MLVTIISASIVSKKGSDKKCHYKLADMIQSSMVICFGCVADVDDHCCKCLVLRIDVDGMRTFDDYLSLDLQLLLSPHKSGMASGPLK